MPQLDFLTYAYQFHWFLLAFTIFYFFTLQVIFPSIAGALKARSKKSLFEKQDLVSVESEEQKGLFSYETLWGKALRIKEKQVSYIQASQRRVSIIQSTK